MRVLIVEDDAPLRQYLQKSFQAMHCQTDVAADDDQASAMAGQDGYDLVILDLNLPERDGLEVLREIRLRNSAVPVLALSSRRDIQDRVRTLDLGADDYLSKPFALAELSARARALTRRSRHGGRQVLHVADLEVNRIERRATRAGKPIDLTPKEMALLEYLMEHEGTCVTRAMIMEDVWKMHSETVTNVVDVYVNYLRKKVDDGFEPRLIHTIRGAGYQIGAATDDGVQ
jgi:DNA-binding response OmpR family regulator